MGCRKRERQRRVGRGRGWRCPSTGEFSLFPRGTFTDLRGREPPLPSPRIDDFAFPPNTGQPAPPPFTFGTFQMNESTGEMVGTPTAELGAFEYPFDAAVSPAIRRLVQDEQPTDPLLLPPGFHPGLRRTSSTSTLPISPAAGRRPSVVHSNTVPQAEVGRRFSLVSGDGTGMGPHSASAVVQAVEEEEAWRESEDNKARRRSSANSLGGGFASPTAGRRPSILAFAHQPLPDTPIPPSLAHLAPHLRRGSIPAHHWPARDRQSSVSAAVGSPIRAGSIGAASGHTAAVVRNSLSGPVFTHRGTREEHVTVSSAYLYQRRSSLASTSRGLLSSKTPLPVPRPGLLPNQQRPSVSSRGSSSGSRESVMTVRDLRNSFDAAEGRPPLARDGSNDSTATERSRRMSMPALASPPTMDAAPPNWTTYPTEADGGFSFPPQVSHRPSQAQPFTLGQPPSPRVVGASGPGTGTDSDRASTSSGSTRPKSHPVGISSSSEDLSDAQDDPPSRRGFRISQRGIEARERRRSSRLSTLAAAGSGNTLETIPSDYVVDFSRSARSSFSAHGGGKLADGRQGQSGGVSALSTSSSEESEERAAEGKPGTEGHEDPSDVEDGGVGTITTAFRAFAFPPRNSVQEGR